MDSPESLDAFGCVKPKRSVSGLPGSLSGELSQPSGDSSVHFIDDADFELPSVEPHEVMEPSESADAAAASDHAIVHVEESDTEFECCDDPLPPPLDCSEYEPSVQWEGDHTAMLQSAVAASEWNQMIAASFAQFRDTPTDMLLPWEQGVFADIFGDAGATSSQELECVGLPESGALYYDVTTSVQTALSDVVDDSCDAKYLKAVRGIADMTYFEDKSQKLEVACGHWLKIISLDWDSFGIGNQLATCLQADHTGGTAIEVLKACFGVKSPSTISKRVGAVKNYISWYGRSGYDTELSACAIPVHEEVIWDYFHYLRNRRIEQQSGYTVPGAFLETIRFCKFTLDLLSADDILTSRRLLGFAAIERREKGPLRQAPSMELEHLRRLHDILESESNIMDRLGAGCFLVCIYGRARWSDLRFVDHVELDRQRNGSMTLYTTEHKTSSVGLRREQFLPIIMPWEGITRKSWVEVFLEVYQECGLDIHCRPLGPLLPAPKPNREFCKRPLSTGEAAAWLRALLHGTKDAEVFRSHSLKATLLVWCAKAGFDRETRSVLGHHCSALTGSEVVYSRHLQTRALRKLTMMLRRVRIGLGIEEESMEAMGIPNTPVPFTPAIGLKTPVVQAAVPATPMPATPVLEKHDSVMASVEETMNDLEDIKSVKDELLDEVTASAAAGELSLFPVELVSSGAIQIESSSGSDSDDSSSESSSSESSPPQAASQAVQFREEAGLYADETAACVSCPVGFYCPGTGQAVACPLNSTTLSGGSSQISACICLAGYYFASVELWCEPCHRTRYKPNIGNGECALTCPTNADSELAATSVDDCFCIPNFHANIDSAGKLASCTSCSYQGLACEGGFVQANIPNTSDLPRVHAQPLATHLGRVFAQAHPLSTSERCL
eukprot:Skav223072  [mRNA]  locus=scaffold419:156706:166109:+ [translate_table: standard]